jgi:hypothetical protein
MELEKIHFKKNDLEKIPDNQRFFFIQAINLLTEINVLNRVACSYLKTTENEIADKSIYCHKIFISVMLGGKLYEGWRILEKNYFGQKVSQEIDSHLSETGKRALNGLKNYFASENLIKKIRQKYAFHYDIDELKKQYNDYRDDEPFELYWSEHMANVFSTTYFDVYHALTKELNDDEDIAAKLFFKNVTGTTGIFREFIGEIILYFSRKYFKNHEVVEVPGQINIYDNSIHYFFNGEFKS